MTAAQTAIGLAVNRRIVSLKRPSIAGAKRILAGSWPLAVMSIATTAYYRLDSFILFNARGAEELDYASAYKFIDAAQLAPSVLMTALLPVIATRVDADPRRRQDVLSLAMRTSTAIGTGIALLLAVLAPRLIPLLYGDDF